MQTSNFAPGVAASAIDTAVRGLGYELVSVDRVPNGLMRVTIDFPWVGDGGRADERFIGVADCERVSRQLQHVLEVEGAAYQRLEVSSPGLDRPLRHATDFERFEGELVEVTLRAPMGGRKHWRGELQRSEQGWRVVLPPVEPVAKGRRASAKSAEGDARAGAGGKKPASGGQAAADADADTDAPRSLDFSLDDLREARLVPTIDFKGRRRPASAAAAGSAKARTQTEVRER